jgi:predicted nucleic acid-binding protein
VILDTNALSALVDDVPEMVARVRPVRELSLPVIVLGEYRYGISRSRRREEYEAWLDRDLSLFRILPVTARTTPHYAALRLALQERGQPIPANDLWIAALAREHRLPIVTRDPHFAQVPGAEVVGW